MGGFCVSVKDVLHAFQPVLVLRSFYSSVTTAVVIIAYVIVARYARLSE